MLCDTCALAWTDIISERLEPSRWRVIKTETATNEFDSSDFGLSFAVGDNHSIFRKARDMSCTMCHHMYHGLKSLFFNDAAYFEPVDSPNLTPYFLSLSPNFPQVMPPLVGGFSWAVCLRSVPSPDKGTNGPTLHYELFLCGPDHRIQDTNNIYELGSRLSPRMKELVGTHMIEDSGSQAAMDLLLTWSKRCLNTHAKCIRRKRLHSLPTRVIDIGPDPLKHGVQYPRLITSNGQKRRYACLSYRWSDRKQQYRTTIENFNAHLEHIPLDQLAPTLQDSIKLVRCTSG